MKIGYTEITKRSFSLAKKSKWLWIYGILLGGGSFNFGRTLGSQDFQNMAYTLPSGFASLEKIFSNWIAGLTPNQTLPFFTSLFVVFIFGVIIRLVVSAWASGAIIFGSQQALQSDKVDLANTSPTGLKYFKRIIVLGVISTLLIIPGVSIFGSRLVVLKNYTPWNAWKAGLKILFSNLLRTIIMGLFSVVIGGLIAFASTLVILIVLGVPGFLLFSAKLYGAIIPLVFIFLWTMAAVSGFTMTFKTLVWNQFFEKVWEK